MHAEDRDAVAETPERARNLGHDLVEILGRSVFLVGVREDGDAHVATVTG